MTGLDWLKKNILSKFRKTEQESVVEQVTTFDSATSCRRCNNIRSKDDALFCGKSYKQILFPLMTTCENWEKK